MNKHQKTPPQEADIQPTPEECLGRMHTMALEYRANRDTYADKRIEWRRAHERTLLYISKGDWRSFSNPEVRAILQTIIEEGRLAKMTIADKEAISHLENQEVWDAYDRAKFDSETSDKAFGHWNSMHIGLIGYRKLEQALDGYEC